MLLGGGAQSLVAWASGCIAESCSHQRVAPGKPQTPSHPGRARLLTSCPLRRFLQGPVTRLRMLAQIGESSRKLFLHREGAAAGRWPQAISPGLHHGLISSFASLGMGLGGCSKRRLSRFQSETQKHLYTQRETWWGDRGDSLLTGTDC